jgi:nucleoside-diphosphate-sugar epimerase
MTTRRDIVFVTGASGFIGKQIVKRLSRENYGVRALVRQVPVDGFDPSIEVVVGDLTKPETYAPSLNGATAILHAALTDDRSNDVRLASTLLDLGAQAGARKFIHLSSIAVYGNPPEGTITEDTPPIKSSDAYSRAKLAIEEALREKSVVPEISVLRIGCVYGRTGGGWWTHGLLQLMQKGRLILVAGGAGTANLIHVEDVAAIIPLLLTRSNPPFDVYNVTDGMPVTWHRYFSELEAILGRTATESMDVAEAREYGRKWLRPSIVGRLSRKLKGTRFVHPLDENAINGFASRAVYSNQKAVTVLGFKPRYCLSKGLRHAPE